MASFKREEQSARGLRAAQLRRVFHTRLPPSRARGTLGAHQWGPTARPALHVQGERKESK